MTTITSGFRQLLAGLSLLLLASPLCFSAEQKALDDPITFGIVPQQSARKLAQAWGPILRHLEERTGRTVIFRTAPNIPAFERRLANEEYDIAYMNPYHYTVFHESSGYNAFAKELDKKLEGIVVVHKDSKIEGLTELEGKILAFPAPAAFAASIVPRANLEQKGISITPKYVSSHDSVYLGVAGGFFAAGGGVMRTFNSLDPKVRDQLRILWTTPGYTPHALAAHSRMSPELIQQISAGLFELHDYPEYAPLLKGLSIKGFMPAQDNNWDDVRSLGIDLPLAN